MEDQPIPQKTLVEIEAEYAKDQAEVDEEKQAGRKFLSLKDNEELDDWLVGEKGMSSYTFSFDASKPAKKMYAFLLRSKTPTGENRVLSFSRRQPVVGKLIKAIKEGKLHIHMQRTGMQSETKYMLMASSQ